MALKAKPPTTENKRLKLLLFGKAGVGKTTTAISFPNAYLIDTEKGAEHEDYVKLMLSKGVESTFCTDYEEVLSQVNSLISEKHKYKTLIIDPLTIIYNELIDKSVSRIARNENCNEDDEKVKTYQRHKATPDRKSKHLINRLLLLDMNVIVTSHAKAEWANSQPTGNDTFDCYPKLDYMFDLSLELTRQGSNLVALVRKTRLGNFQRGERFAVSYDEIANRYGRDKIERTAVSVALSTPEQVEEILLLLQERKDAAEWQEKCFEKAGGASSWDEMPTELTAKAIDFLKNPKKQGAAA